ncbi:OpgC domain-containing protein [uncultured Pelagimonas sp.]|uniref:OpgC domain-containing protein n=1 Tax=uncultured Pelagimonas sp. TaxID=1618102 RepID=UPI002624990D|nr:OpgC domain-containing protein [uncultured Pelagimonas sp.]
MRLDLLDGIRGHLLIMMMLAHLSWQPGMDALGLVHHARIIGLFDAEFLIFVSGLLIGILTVRKFKTSENLHRFLGQRLKKIYGYYILSALPFLALSTLKAVEEQSLFHDVPWAIFQVFTIQNGGGYSDILPIYLYCFVLLLVGSLTLARFGSLALLAASFSIYALSLPNFSYGFFGLGDAFMAFDVAAWQFLFFVAYFLGLHHQRIYDTLTGLSTPGFFALLATTGALLLWQRSGVTYHDVFARPPGLPDNWPRMHLHPTHLIRTLIVCGFFAVLMIRKHRLTSFATRSVDWYFNLKLVRYTGIFSIQMFVLHVYLMAVFQYAGEDMSHSSRIAFALFLMGVFLVSPFAFLKQKSLLQSVQPLWLRAKTRFGY